MDQRNLIEENEREVNESLRQICIKMSVMVPIFLLCRIFNVILMSWDRMIMASCLGAVTLGIPIFANKFVKPWMIKWIMVLDFTIFTSFLYVIAYGVSLLFFMLPLAIGALYYDRKLIKGSMIIATIGLLIGELASCYFESYYIAGYQWVPVHMIMLVVQVVVLGTVLLQLAKRTYAMLNQSQELNESIKEHLDTNMELSRVLGTSIYEVNENMEQSNQGIYQVGESISKIAKSSKTIVEVAKGTEQIVDQSVENIQSAVKQTDEIKKINGKMEEVTTQNKESIAVFTKATEQIKAKTDYSKNRMQQLEEKIQLVNETVGLIGEISSQTELLALNASIEAARSGEAGKGFAVIAGQVKSLATEAAACNNRISELIETVSTDSKEVVAAIDDNYSEVEKSVSYMNETNKSFDYFLEVQKTMAEQTISISNKIGTFIEQSHTIQAHIQELLSMNAINAEEIVEIEHAINEIRIKANNIDSSMKEMEQHAKKLVDGVDA